jgi:hypothetical protein
MHRLNAHGVIMKPQSWAGRNDTYALTTPARLGPHPGLALPTAAPRIPLDEFGVGRREIGAIGRDHRVRQDPAEIHVGPRAAKGGDGVVNRMVSGLVQNDVVSVVPSLSFSASS